MKKILYLILFLLSYSCFAQNDNPLLGEWVLDKEATLFYSENHKLLTSIKEQAWKASRTKITITNNVISTDYGSEIVKSSYNIAGINKSKVTIKFNNTEQATTFYLTNNGFYLLVDETDREFYIKNE